MQQKEGSKPYFFAGSNGSNEFFAVTIWCSNSRGYISYTDVLQGFHLISALSRLVNSVFVSPERCVLFRFGVVGFSTNRDPGPMTHSDVIEIVLHLYAAGVWNPCENCLCDTVDG